MTKFTVMTAEVSGVVVLKNPNEHHHGMMPEFALAASTMKEACDYLMKEAGETVQDTVAATIPAFYSKHKAHPAVSLAQDIVAVSARSMSYDKVAAIKLLRNITAMPLKQCKELIEDAREWSQTGRVMRRPN